MSTPDPQSPLRDNPEGMTDEERLRVILAKVDFVRDVAPDEFVHGLSENQVDAIMDLYWATSLALRLLEDRDRFSTVLDQVVVALEGIKTTRGTVANAVNAAAWVQAGVALDRARRALHPELSLGEVFRLDTAPFEVGDVLTLRLPDAPACHYRITAMSGRAGFALEPFTP